MFHRLNDKGDNLLTEIPGCPEKRIYTERLYLSNCSGRQDTSRSVVREATLIEKRIILDFTWECANGLLSNFNYTMARRK